jgi:hypothetical protein
VQAIKDSAKSFAKDDESRETGGLDQAAFCVDAERSGGIEGRPSLA